MWSIVSIRKKSLCIGEFLFTLNIFLLDKMLYSPLKSVVAEILFITIQSLLRSLSSVTFVCFGFLWSLFEPNFCCRRTLHDVVLGFRFWLGLLQLEKHGAPQLHPERAADAGIFVVALVGHVAHRERGRTGADGRHPQDHRQPTLVQQQVPSLKYLNSSKTFNNYF